MARTHHNRKSLEKESIGKEKGEDECHSSRCKTISKPMRNMKRLSMDIECWRNESPRTCIQAKRHFDEKNTN